LLVRGRLKGDIERTFPEAKVTEADIADYRFRAVVSRLEVAAVIHDALLTIDYPNFKDSVEDGERHNVYLGVWHTMLRAQTREQGGDKAWFDQPWEWADDDEAPGDKPNPPAARREKGITGLLPGDKVEVFTRDADGMLVPWDGVPEPDDTDYRDEIE
jgi:hypothetical protein